MVGVQRSMEMQQVLTGAPSASGYFFTCEHSFHEMKGRNSEPVYEINRPKGSEGILHDAVHANPEENISMDPPFPIRLRYRKLPLEQMCV